mgnify:CR=1 FL=1
MELKDFVSQTITQIIEGVHVAQETCSTGEVNPHLARPGAAEGKLHFASNWNPIESVKFSVSVTVSDVAGVGAKIGVVSGLINASLGGQGEQSRESINRIEFTVPICYPQSSK